MPNEDSRIKATEQEMDDISAGATARTPVAGGSDAQSDDQDQGGRQGPGAGVADDDLSGAVGGASARTPMAGGSGSQSDDQDEGGRQGPGAGVADDDLSGAVGGSIRPSPNIKIKIDSNDLSSPEADPID